MAVPEQRSNLLPAIKCSQCGEDVFLAFMGEHTCRPGSGDRLTQLPDLTQPLPLTTPSPAPEITFLKPQRPLLPRIDVNAGNRPPPGMFLGELTPASSGRGSSIMASPRSASSGQRSPWRLPPRKPSGPPVRRPPSPELISQDCAFPHFPTSAPTRSKTPTQDKKSRKSSAGNDYRRTQGGTYNQSAASTPRSSVLGSGQLRKTRTASITSSKQRNPSGMRANGYSQPASANTSRRPSFSSVPATRKGSVNDVPPLPVTTGTSPRIEDFQITPPTATEDTRSGDRAIQQPWSSPLTADQFEQDSESGAPMEALTLSETNKSIPGVAAQEHVNANPPPTIKKQPSYKAKRPPPIDSGKSLPLLQRFKSILTPRSRAPTFPLPNTDSRSGMVSDTSRRPSNPASFSSIAQNRPPPEGDEEIPESQSPETMKSEFDWANPRSSVEVSSEQSKTDEKLEEPTLINFSQHQGDLGASSASPGLNWLIMDQKSPITDERPNNNSPTPAAAVDRLVVSSEIWSTAAGDAGPPAETAEQSVEQSRSVLHRSVDSASSYGSSVTLSLQSTSSRSSIPPSNDGTHTRSNTTYSISDFPALDETMTAPMPTLSEGEEPRVRTRSRANTNAASQPPKPSIEDLPPLMPPRIAEMQPDSPTDPLYQQGRLSPIPDSIDRHNPSTSRNTSQPADQSAFAGSKTAASPNKGTCRGCQQLILASQKSVSSADGRLTGRYHKECFVCRTCREGFSTADFYVLEDHPYCGQHYHELNGTICGSCGKGIEGQHMETSTVAGKPSKKFHAACLCCSTCRIQLREDYFEFNGRIYCEKDAFRLASLGEKKKDSAPARSSPLIRELVSASYGGEDSMLGVEGLGGRFPERRLTRLMETGTNITNVV